VVGGNAGSFEQAGQRLDYGSHRLHPACDPEVLADIRALLGEDLLDRPRHGRIRLRGRWIHFPLKPVDLLLRLDPRFAAGTLRDMALKALPRSAAGDDTFASVLLANLGPTICRDFYFPYARKIWGREPEALSGIQARRRVSAGSFAMCARCCRRAGLKPPAPAALTARLRGDH
jgi:protoporphyrinogen oxidase